MRDFATSAADAKRTGPNKVFYTAVINLLIAVMGVGGYLYSYFKTPVTALGAMDALKRMEAKYSAGLAYNDFSKALGETKLIANMFLESGDAEKRVHRRLAEHIKKSLESYELAREIWAAVILRRAISADSPLGCRILAYPGANNEVSQGGVLQTVARGEEELPQRLVEAGAALSFIMKEASRESALALKRPLKERW